MIVHSRASLYRCALSIPPSRNRRLDAAWRSMRHSSRRCLHLANPMICTRCDRAFASAATAAPATNRDGVAAAAAPQAVKYEVLLHVLAGLLSSGQLESKLPLLAAAQPDITSMGFMHWLAAQERKKEQDPVDKDTLGTLCAVLVGLREATEANQLAEQHRVIMADVRARLPAQSSADDGPVEEEEELSLREMASSHPTRLAMQVAEVVTGVPVQPELYEPKYEAGLRLSPPMSLTQAGVKRGMEQAEVLAADITARKKRTLAAFMGRAQLQQQQVVQVLGGTPASRILDVLLSMSDHSQRLDALSDAFTPPGAEEEQQEVSINQFAARDAAGEGGAEELGNTGQATSTSGVDGDDRGASFYRIWQDAADRMDAGAGSSGSNATILEPEVFFGADGSGLDAVGDAERRGNVTSSSEGSTSDSDSDVGAQSGDVEEQDMLWCTPMQLLSEIDRRMQAVAAGPVAGQLPGAVGAMPQPQALPSPNLESGEQLTDALQLLRQEIADNWLKQF